MARPTCCFCGNTISAWTQDYPLSESEKNERVCSKCIDRLEVLMASDPKIARKEFQHFSSIMDSNNASQKAKEYIKDRLDQLDASISATTVADDIKSFGSSLINSSNGDKSSTIWIQGLKIGAWLLFAAIVIIGIIIASPLFNDHYGNPQLAVAIVIASLIVGFFAIAGVMVFLNMAQDIRNIRLNVRDFPMRFDNHNNNP